MIECINSGSYGVNLFRFAYGRILSERSGYALTVLPLQMPGGSRLSVGHSYCYPVIGVTGNAPRDTVLGRSLQYIERGLLPRARLQLCGTFWRADLYAEKRDVFREDWLNVGNLPNLAQDDSALFVSWNVIKTFSEHALDVIRQRGRKQDNAGKAWVEAAPAIPVSFINELTRDLGLSRIVLVTGCLPEARRIRGLNVAHEWMVADPPRRLQILASARHVLLRAFDEVDWWAGFLNRGTPHMHSQFSNADLMRGG